MTQLLEFFASLVSILLVVVTVALLFYLLGAIGLTAQQALTKRRSRRYRQDGCEEIRLTVEVAGSEDPAKVYTALIDAADSLPDSIAAKPVPSVRVLREEENRTELELTVCRRPDGTSLMSFLHSLYFRIYRTFRARGVSLPDVSRDIENRGDKTALRG